MILSLNGVTNNYYDRTGNAVGLETEQDMKDRNIQVNIPELFDMERKFTVLRLGS